MSVSHHVRVGGLTVRFLSGKSAIVLRGSGLGVMRREARRLGRIVSDLLDLSRIERGLGD
jgi:signal transduction histidine kinase